MVNKAFLVGRLGADPETGETQRGGRWCKFSLATSRKWTDKASGEKREKTQWHRVVIWGDGLANECARRLKKGSQVACEGEIETRKFQTKDGRDGYVTEIVIQGYGGQVVFCDGASGSGGVPDPQEPDGYRAPSSMEA